MTSRQAKAAYKAKGRIHGEKSKTWRQRQEEYREQECLLREEEERERGKRKREMRKAIKKEKERLEGNKPVVMRASQPQVTSFFRAEKGGCQKRQTVDKTQDMEPSSPAHSPLRMVSSNSKVLLEPTAPLSTQKALERVIGGLTPPHARPQIRCNITLAHCPSSTPDTPESNAPREAMSQPEKLVNAGTLSQPPTPSGPRDALPASPGPVDNFRSPRHKANSIEESRASSSSSEDEFFDALSPSQASAPSPKTKCEKSNVEGIPKQPYTRTSDTFRQMTKDVTQEHEGFWHEETAKACPSSKRQADAEHFEVPGMQVSADKSVDSSSIFDDSVFDISSSQQAELERVALEQEALRQQMRNGKGRKDKAMGGQGEKEMSQEPCNSSRISSPDEFPITPSQEAALLAAAESQETSKDTGVADRDMRETKDNRQASVPIEVSLTSGEMMVIDPNDFEDDSEI